MTLIFTLFLSLLFITIYFTPALIAVQRGHSQTVSIAIVNFFFGWSLLGWVVALVWAFTTYPDMKS